MSSRRNLNTTASSVGRGGKGRKGGPGDTFVHLIGESGGVSEDSGNVILLIGSSLDDYLLLTFKDPREAPRDEGKPEERSKDFRVAVQHKRSAT